METTSLEVTVYNAASPHTYKVWPFEPPEDVTCIEVESHPTALSGWGRTLKDALRARRQVRQARRTGASTLVLAHGAGRAGLIARLLIDPHPFVIVYGSEVVEANERGWLSRTLTTRTVSAASGLAVATPAMLPPIEALVPGATDKTRIVGMPVDWARFGAGVPRRGPETPRVLSVRRMLPLYRIVEIVEAASQIPDMQLSLLRGAVTDTEPYADEVDRTVARFLPDTEVLTDFFDVDGLVDQYSRTDVAVSVPEHDQMSVGMLEALGAGCTAVLSDLPSYTFLRGLDHVFWVKDPSDVAELRQAMTDALVHHAGAPSDEDRARRAAAVRQAYEETFPPESPVQ